MKMGFRKPAMGFLKKIMTGNGILMKKVGWEWDWTSPSEPSKKVQEKNCSTSKEF